MDRAWPKTGQGVHMLARTVALVPSKSIAWVHGIEANHQGIPVDLCQNAGGSDAGAARIAPDDELGGVRESRKGEPVHQNEVHEDTEVPQGQNHGLRRGPQNVHRINALGADFGQSKTYAWMRKETGSNHLPLTRTERFGVGDRHVNAHDRKHHSRRHDRTGKGTPTDLVDSRYSTVSLRLCAPFMDIKVHRSSSGPIGEAPGLTLRHSCCCCCSLTRADLPTRSRK